MLMVNIDCSNYDPRKAEWEGTTIELWEPAKWKLWKAKFPSSDEEAKLEREYLRIKYSVQQANSALSLDRVKIKLKLVTPKSLGLQGTFPCRPGDLGRYGSNNKQYTLCLGFTANDVGVKAATTKARELDLLLVTKQFQWTPELLGKQAQKVFGELEENSKLVKEYIKEYEEEFWKSHEKNRQGVRTWDTHYWRHLKKLPQDVPLSVDALEAALQKTKPNSSARFFLSWQLKKFCDFCSFEGGKVINSYSTPQPSPSLRQIPDDDAVVEGFERVGEPLSPFASRENLTLPEQWQWAYGMLATYGLRPHELFAVDIDAFLDTGNTFHLVTIKPSLTEGTKTGERNCGIPPLHPHWVTLFDLKNIKLPYTGGTLSNKTAKIHIRFRNTHIGFRPYDLRHAYAIRGHRLRIPIKTMSDYMGHTVQEHTRTYQRWMSEDANLEIYKEVVIQKQNSGRDALREVIKELEAENAALKAENTTLKAILAKHQIGDFSS